MIANTISIILFFLSATMVFLRYCLSRRISSYLIAEDIKHTNGIVQHQFGWISTMVCVLPAAISISISLIKNGDYFFFVLMLIPVVFLLRRKSIVTVLLDSGNIVIKDRKKTHIFPISSVRTVSWKPTDLRFCYCLEICIDDHIPFYFPQDSYWGISDMYSKLNNLIKQPPAEQDT